MKHLLTMLLALAAVGCDRTEDAVSRTVETIVNPTGDLSVKLSFPEELQGKDVWYFLKNQHRGTDFTSAFSVPDDGAPLPMIVSGDERRVTALTHKTPEEDSFFGRAQDLESFPHFAVQAAHEGLTDFEDFALLFASSEAALNAALRGEFVSYPDLGEDRFVVISLKQPNDVFLPGARSQTAQNKPTLASPIPPAVD